MQRSSWGTIAGVVGMLLLAAGERPASAAEAVIDNFTDATALTTFVPDMNVLQDTIGSTVRDDTGLTQVIGGTRTLTVTATSLGFPGLDYIVAGVSLMPINFFEYNSRTGADGSTVLLYDANGSGLNAMLGFAQGLQVLIREADLAAVMMPGMDVTVTVTDGNMVTASQTQTVTMAVSAMAPLALDFPYSGFTGIDPNNIFSIQITLDPQEAGDTRLNLLGTFGTPINETICDDGIDNNNNGFTDCQDRDCILSPACETRRAPAMSPLGFGLAAAVLALVAHLAMRRMREPR